MNNFKEVLGYICVASLFGLVKHLKTLTSGKRPFNPSRLVDWFDSILELITSALMGLLMYWLTINFNLEQSLSYVLTAVAGHFGGDIFPMIRKYTHLKLGIKNDEQ